MVITVETGSGVANADSYSSVADADTYFASFGNTVWSGKTLEQKEVALRKASFYMDNRWAARITGEKLNSSQGLSLPVKGLYTPAGALINGIPKGWKAALYEYAMKTFSGDLFEGSAGGTGGQVTKKRVTVGPITTINEYAAPVSTTTQSFAAADMLVKNAIRAKGNSGGSVIR